MAIEDTPLYQEILEVMGTGPKKVHYYWDCEIHTPTEDLSVMRVVSVDIIRDYSENYSDVIMLEVMIPAGTFDFRVYPAKHQLEVTLFKTPVREVGDVEDQDLYREMQRYTATLVDQGSGVIENNSPTQENEQAANLSDTKTVAFQLMDVAIGQLRFKEVGGIYRHNTPGDVARTILGAASRTVKVPRENRPKGVDIWPPDNTTPRSHVIVPHDTKLPMLAGFLQRECGIYTAGIGFYYQRGIWYIFPEFGIKDRWKKAPRKLTILNVPQHKLPGIERTYRVDDGNITVLSTGEVKLLDDSEQLQLNRGNGVRFTDASQFVDGFVETGGNKAIARRGQINNEFIGLGRQDKTKNAPMSDRRITANPFVEYSELARRNCSHLQMTWENSEETLIYPGMPVRVLYLEGTRVRRLEGVVAGAHHFVTGQGQGITIKRHKTNTALSLLVGRDVVWQ